LIITAPAITIPPELGSLVEYLELPLPDRSRLRQIIDEMVVRLGKTRTLKRTLDASGVDALAENLRGLTELEAERALSQAIVSRYALCPETVCDVLEAKKDLLRHSQHAGICRCLAKSSRCRRTGKSQELAGSTSWGVGKLRPAIWIGTAQGGHHSWRPRLWQIALCSRHCRRLENSASQIRHGCNLRQIHRRNRKAHSEGLRVAEGLAPCVLWIDELEKVFAGSGPDSASVDAGVSSRILAAFLSWMQDRKAPVFVAATCNNVTVLPPELIRKGRFDELFLR
jgi:hypothetical protein